MRYIAGIKLLERGVILQYMKQAGGPVSMPEILGLRGILIPKRGEGSEGAKKNFASKASIARQLMLRLCEDGYAVADKGRHGPWSLRFVLTPKGLQAAGECEEFLAYINALQHKVAQALVARSGAIRAPAFRPGERAPGEDAKVTLDQSPLKVAPEPEIPTLPPVVVQPAPQVVPEALAKVSSNLPPKPSRKATVSAPLPPMVAPRPVVILLPKATSSTLQCPSCPNEFPLASVKRELDRRGRFECDCGADLTGKATELLGGIAAGA